MKKILINRFLTQLANDKIINQIQKLENSAKNKKLN